MERERLSMKLYESLNKDVNKKFKEASFLLPAAIYGGAGLASYVGGKELWKGLRRHVLQRDNPDEFNFVRGGMFSDPLSSTNFKSLNQRIVKNVLGPYLKKDAAGNIVFDNVKLNHLKQDDPELFNMIFKLQKDIAWSNNRSNLWMSRKHKDMIRNDLNHIEEYLSTHRKTLTPFSDDTLKIFNKHPITRSLLYKFNNAKPGSDEQRKLYTLLMRAERKLVNSRTNVKNAYMASDVDRYIGNNNPFEAK